MLEFEQGILVRVGKMFLSTYVRQDVWMMMMMMMTFLVDCVCGADGELTMTTCLTSLGVILGVEWMTIANHVPMYCAQSFAARN